jgi:hypothetical protein
LFKTGENEWGKYQKKRTRGRVEWFGGERERERRREGIRKGEERRSERDKEGDKREAERRR